MLAETLESKDMLAIIKSLVKPFVMPLPIALTLILIGAVLLKFGRRRGGFRFAASGMILIALASWGPVAERLLRPLEQRHAPLTDVAALGEVAAVVVLGGGWQPKPDWPISAQLNESSAIRLFEGLRLLRALPEARLIVSGGSRHGDLEPIAVGYAQAAREMGVPAERILLLDTPVDTAQEAYAVKAALGMDRPFLLVTSASHMARAMRHFETAGLAPIAAPTHFRTGRRETERLKYWIPSADQLRKTERAVYEYLGLLALHWDHR